jgi:hypothetical protein
LIKHTSMLIALLIAVLLVACNAPGVAGAPPTAALTPSPTAAITTTDAAPQPDAVTPTLAATEAPADEPGGLPEGWSKHRHADSGALIGVPPGWAAEDSDGIVAVRENSGDGWANLIPPSANAGPGIALDLGSSGDPSTTLSSALGALQQNGEFGAVQTFSEDQGNAAYVEGFYEPFAEQLFIGVIALPSGQAVLIGHGVESSEPGADWDYLSAIYQQMLITVTQEDD